MPTLVPILFGLGKDAYRNLKLNWLKQKGGYYCCCPVAKSCLTLWDPLGRSSPCFPVLHFVGICSDSCPLDSCPLSGIMSMMPSNHLILCCLLLLLPSIFPSIRIFCSELALHIMWLKHWSFSFSISPSNEYSGLISFRIDWFDLLAVLGTLKSLLQHHKGGY